MNKANFMSSLKDHYDLIAVAVLIALLAFAPSAAKFDPNLQFVHFDQPVLVIAHGDRP